MPVVPATAAPASAPCPEPASAPCPEPASAPCPEPSNDISLSQSSSDSPVGISPARQRFRRAIIGVKMRLRASRAFQTSVPLPRRRWKAAIRSVVRTVRVFGGKLRFSPPTVPERANEGAGEDPAHGAEEGVRAADAAAAAATSASAAAQASSASVPTSASAAAPPSAAPVPAPAALPAHPARLRQRSRTLSAVFSKVVQEKREERTQLGDELLKTVSGIEAALPDLSVLQKLFQEEMRKFEEPPQPRVADAGGADGGAGGGASHADGASASATEGAGSSGAEGGGVEGGLPSPRSRAASTSSSAMPKLKRMDSINIQRRLSEARSKMLVAKDVISAVDRMQRKSQPTRSDPRASFLHLYTLPEILGAPPDHSWRDEWSDLLGDLRWREGHAASREEGAAWARAAASLDEREAQLAPMIEDMGTRGWSRAHATAYLCLTPVATILGAQMRARYEALRAVHDDACDGGRPAAPAAEAGDEGPRVTASCYALSDAIFAAHARQQQSSSSSSSPEPLYWNLHGSKRSLTALDPSWSQIERPDPIFGQKFVVSAACIFGTREPCCFEQRGFCPRVVDWQTGDAAYEPAVDSPVVMFEAPPTRARTGAEGGSRAEDGDGGDGDAEGGSGGAAAAADTQHAAVLTSTAERGVFPPNVRFTLVRTLAPGEWVAPGGARPQQPLLVVRASYRRPTAGTVALARAGSKMCPSVNTLHFGDRRTWLVGLGDVLDRQPLTMEAEFARSISFSDWRGGTHTLRTEWAYVHGPAKQRYTSIMKVRDEGRDGWTLQDFVRRVNAGCTDAELCLNEEEVTALRLYSGPCYQLINGFLRQLSRMNDGDRGRSGINYRMWFAASDEVTFAATCRHIYTGITKLAQRKRKGAEPTGGAEGGGGTEGGGGGGGASTASLWRGMRGELPWTLWDQREPVLCEPGFLSASSDRAVALEYMGDGEPNVLLEILQPDAHELSDAFSLTLQSGADISMISQFGCENEILYPPCLLLEMVPWDDGADGVGADRSLSPAEEPVASDAKAEQGTGSAPAQRVLSTDSHDLKRLDTARRFRRPLVAVDEAEAALLGSKQVTVLRVRPHVSGVL